MTEEILIGLGGNIPSHIGSPLETIERALTLLVQGGDVTVIARSGMYQTAPVPVSDQPDFINMAVSVKTHLSAHELLALFQSIEVGCGRKSAERWSARTLDIDLLAYGNQVLPSEGAWVQVVTDKDPAAFLPEPVVPHPRLHKRAFVLIPLLDIAPNWRHPKLKRSVLELSEQEFIVTESAGVSKISPFL